MSKPSIAPPSPWHAIAGYGAIAWGLVLFVVVLQRALAGTTTQQPLIVAGLVAGAFEVVFGAGVVLRKRLAWSFAIGLNGVLGLAFTIAGPALGRVLSPHALAIVPPVVAILLVVALIHAADAFGVVDE